MQFSFRPPALLFRLGGNIFQGVLVAVDKGRKVVVATGFDFGINHVMDLQHGFHITPMRAGHGRDAGFGFVVHAFHPIGTERQTHTSTRGLSRLGGWREMVRMLIWPSSPQNPALVSASKTGLGRLSMS